MWSLSFYVLCVILSCPAMTLCHLEGLSIDSKCCCSELMEKMNVRDLWLFWSISATVA
jgi:hypothetical protein